MKTSKVKNYVFLKAWKQNTKGASRWNIEGRTPACRGKLDKVIAQFLSDPNRLPTFDLCVEKEAMMNACKTEMRDIVAEWREIAKYER